MLFFRIITWFYKIIFIKIIKKKKKNKKHTHTTRHLEEKLKNRIVGLRQAKMTYKGTFALLKERKY